MNILGVNTMTSTKNWMKKKFSKNFPSLPGTSANRSYATFQQWRTYFLRGTDHDRWQQMENAVKCYEMLSNDIDEFLRTGETSTNNEIIFLRDEQKVTASKISLCVKCRIEAIKNESNNHWMTIAELMRLKPVLRNFYTWQGIFPILIKEEANKSKTSLLSQDSGLSELNSSDDDYENDGNNLLPRLPNEKGMSRFYVRIGKFGLKKPEKIKDPFLVITLRDKDSVNLSKPQAVNKVFKIEDYHAFFDTKVEVQRYIEKIPKGSALFFELKTLPNRETKYYAFLPSEEFVNGEAYLELYKGPVDFHRKRCVKVTYTKPLYLHIDMNIIPSEESPKYGRRRRVKQAYC